MPRRWGIVAGDSSFRNVWSFFSARKNDFADFESYFLLEMEIFSRP